MPTDWDAYGGNKRTKRIYQEQNNLWCVSQIASKRPLAHRASLQMKLAILLYHSVCKKDCRIQTF